MIFLKLFLICTFKDPNLPKKLTNFAPNLDPNLAKKFGGKSKKKNLPSGVHEVCFVQVCGKWCEKAESNSSWTLLLF